MRNSLVVALTACAETPLQPKARRFLAGLSCDELQFIAGYFGGCILRINTGSEPSSRADCFCGEAAGLPAADLDHKLILVQEYLCYSRPVRLSPSAPAARP